MSRRRSRIVQIRPRSDEWKPIAELLDSGTYDTPESLAKAVLVSAYHTLLQREWYLNIVRLSDDGEKPVQVAYGLFASEAEAEKSARGAGFKRMTIPVTPEGTPE